MSFLDNRNSKIKFGTLITLILVDLALLFVCYLFLPSFKFSDFFITTFIGPFFILMVLGGIFGILLITLPLIILFFIIYKLLNFFFESSFIFKFTFFLLLLIMLGFIINLYFSRVFLIPAQKISNADIETISWKVYKNTDHGFEIKYPPNWKLKETNSNQRIVNFCPPEAQECDDPTRTHPHEHVAVFFSEIDEDSIYNYVTKELFGFDKKIYKTNDGIKIIEIIITTSRKHPDHLAIIYVNDKIYKISAAYNTFDQMELGKRDSDNIATFNKMLTTIRPVK